MSHELHASEPEHAANPVYQSILKADHRLSGVEVRLARPTLADGLSAAEETAALVEKIGSAPRLEAMLADSISAPTEVRLSDLRSGEDAVVRVAEIFFAVRADEGAIDAAEIERKADEKGVVEAGNMRFASRDIPPAKLKGHDLTPAIGPDGRPTERYLHIEGKILDRIAVEATDRIFASRSKGSLIVASETSPKFDVDADFPNRWWKLEGNKPGPSSPFPGGFGYVKISKLAMAPGVLWVEAHFAFAEPKGWFGGEPVLRSKIGLATQDQVRKLRRELAERKKRPRGNP